METNGNRGKRGQKTVDAIIHGEVARSIENIAAQTARPNPAFWLSFVRDGKFRGALIIHADDFTEALTRSHLMKLNPGGEVAGKFIPARWAADIPEHWKNRLLSRTDIEQFDRKMKTSRKGAYENGEQQSTPI